MINKIIIQTLISTTLIFGCCQVFAWSATAHNGMYTYTSFDYANSEESKLAALDGCKKNFGSECELMEDTFHGTAIVIVTGSGNITKIANVDPELAAKNALIDCNKVYKSGEKCSIKHVFWDKGGQWLSLAWGEGAKYHMQQDTSKELADSLALEECEKITTTKGSCVIQDYISGSGAYYVALAKSPSFSSFNRASTKKEAIRLVLSACKAESSKGDICKIEWTEFNEGPMKAPASIKKISALIIKMEKEKMHELEIAIKQLQNQRKTTRNLSCTNRCQNGSCIRTFSNGASENWQAPQVFNAFTNSWGWDTTTNACGQ